MHGGSQVDFAKQYGSDQKSISVYELGIQKPRTPFLLRLSAAFGITPETLLTVKLKADRTGTIINIPSRDKEIQAVRQELKRLMNEFDANVKKLFKGLTIL